MLELLDFLGIFALLTVAVVIGKGRGKAPRQQKEALFQGVPVSLLEQKEIREWMLDLAERSQPAPKAPSGTGGMASVNKALAFYQQFGGGMKPRQQVVEE